MVFGKRQRESIVIEEDFEDDDDLMIYSDNENTQNNEAAVEDGSTINTTSSKEKRVDSSSKPLLDEVILKGVPNIKNLGGAKKWQCKHCNKNFTSTYTRIHAHFFGVPAGKK
ncbi:hypothetical protein FRX31_007264 [Thalictrum thalictroides]|uniref:Zinc finger protein n=1 Tax=Thalictrum thalictroides TaxID=46969 RepID=A0A7J6X3G1_THATH|nr:hypothetical protein FRX31_007264 [Thalictrum thalictroides]